MEPKLSSQQQQNRSGQLGNFDQKYIEITQGPGQNHIIGEVITLLPNDKFLVLKKNEDKLSKHQDDLTTLQCDKADGTEVNDGDIIIADYLPIKNSNEYGYIIVKVSQKSQESQKPKRPRKYQSILKKPSMIGKPSTIVETELNQNQPAIDYKTINLNTLDVGDKKTAVDMLQYQLDVREQILEPYQKSLHKKRPKQPPNPQPTESVSSIRSMISQRNQQSMIKQAGRIGSIFQKSRIEKEQSKIQALQMNDHAIPLKELCKKLEIEDLEKGLSSAQCEKKIMEFGLNKLPKKKRTPGWVIFMRELVTWFSLMLWFGCALCIIGYSLDTSSGLGSVYFAIIIIIVIFITTTITYMQNAKSEALMESFKKMLPGACYALRDGTMTSVEPDQLVPGDIISVQSGDKIPADIRIIYSNEMKVDNSPLTGESLPLRRTDQCTNPDFMESANMAFFGTVVKEGRGKGIVVKTGANTVLGQLALEVAGDKKMKTPLRIELDRFVYMISLIASGLMILFFFSARYVVKYSWVDSIIVGVSILLANVPEGLLGCITISLAITAEILAKKQVLVKNLESVETLGSTSCICSDKTGTLTQNKMTVEHIWYDCKIRTGANRQLWQNTLKEKGVQLEYSTEDLTFRELHLCTITSSEAVFQVPKEDYEKTDWLKAQVKGDASEAALVKFFQPIEDISKTREENLIAKTGKGENAVLPFNSNNKFALTIVEQLTKESYYTAYIKGAPEKIWKLCSYLMHEGQPQEINKQLEKLFNNVNLKFMSNGERVLGFAQLRLDRNKFPQGFEFDVSAVDKFNFEFKDFTFLGLISLQDPPKIAVPFAVMKCRSAGIKVIMVTGDSPSTAAAISKQVNIIDKNAKTNLDIMIEEEERGNPITWQQATERADAIIINGDQINQQLAADNKNKKEGEKEDDSGIQRWIKKPYCCFARTTPLHKLKIVQACQKAGHIVGVTGDGVNDSPAIKQANIGISMGITGSDVTKDAADMVLLNDDFASIVDGIQEGRKIFDNLKKSIVYLLTGNIAQILAYTSQLIFLYPLPLNNMLMMTISVGTDILPTIAFAYEKAELDIMTRRPRTQADHLVTVRLITHSYLQMGWIAAAGGFFGYFTTMWYYGFTMSGLFGLVASDVLIAKRGGDIPFGSYNPDLPNLGNPYLDMDDSGNVDCRLNSSNRVAYTSNENSSENDGWTNLDWQNQPDEEYDLRQILIECDQDTGYWRTRSDTWKDCQSIDGSEELGFAALIQGAENGDIDMFSRSTQKHTYRTIADPNSATGESRPYGENVKVPVCYSTEALKWAQSAYFVAVVITQWSNVIAVKAKKMSFIYTEWNKWMLYGIFLETAIAIILCYIPGVQLVFMARPLIFIQWWPGAIFSIMLLVWCEIRKSLLRRKPTGPPGKNSFWVRNIMW